MIVSDYRGPLPGQELEPCSPPRRVFMIISSLRPFDDGRMDRGTCMGTTDDFNSILFYQTRSGVAGLNKSIRNKSMEARVEVERTTVMYFSME